MLEIVKKEKQLVTLKPFALITIMDSAANVKEVTMGMVQIA